MESSVNRKLTLQGFKDVFFLYFMVLTGTSEFVIDHEVKTLYNDKNFSD